MHISAPFIRRPVATALLSVAILLAGGGAFYFLPVAALPHVDFPTIYVRSEEHTSELQSPDHLVCRLLLEKKNEIKRVSAFFIHGAPHDNSPDLHAILPIL